jgi:hypothetical protein
MNPEIKAKWVAALRSEEYKQGKKVLNNGVGNFCCLGVLCDLYAKENSVQWTDVLGGHEEETLQEFLGNIAVLPDEVQNWAGLSGKNPYVKHNRNLNEVNQEIYKFGPLEKEENLVTLNDSGKFTFNDIADLIEAQL